MRTAATLAIVSALVLTVTPPALADQREEPPTRVGSVTVHKIGPVAHYRLVEPWDDEEGSQTDYGSVKVHYTCHPGDTGVLQTNVFVYGLPMPTADRFGEGTPCDGERHVVDVALGRGSDSPFTPQQRRVDAEAGAVFAFFCENCGGVEVEETFPVRFLYQGW